jgi:CBS domain containing-hemolysin-like protein
MIVAAAAGAVGPSGIAWGVVLLVANGFFVAVEIALLAARRGRLEEANERGDRRAGRALAALDVLQFNFSAAQLGITLASLGLGAVMEPAMAGVLERVLGGLAVPGAVAGALSVAVAFAVVVFLHMVVGEMAPKNLALTRPERVALALVGPFAVFVAALRPVIVVLDALSNALARLVGVQPVSGNDLVHTPEELALVLGEANRRGTISFEDVRLLSAVLRLSERVAEDAMTPRTDLAMLPSDATIDEALELAARSGRTRLPVFGRDADDVVGLVHVKDLLVADVRSGPSAADRGGLGGAVREIVAVPASTDLDRLLRQMLEGRSQAVLVVDEYGGTAGLVTLEDVVEELVGDISDEFDEDRELLDVAPGVWLARGVMRRDELESDLGLVLPDGDSETLSGWMVERLGRLVVRGDRVETPEGWRLVVRTVEGRRAGDVEVRAPRDGT